MVHQGIKSPKKKAITIRYDPYSNQRNGLKSQAKRKTSSSIGRLVSISKGDTRKRSSDSLCESNKLISNSVHNLTTVDVNCNNSSHRRGLPTEPCCLCCGPGIKATKNRKHTRSDQRFDGSRKNLSSLKDVHDDDSVQAERYVPSQELYKKLIKEHLQLESSFKLLCQRLEEERERSVSESQEKQLLKEQVNNLTRKVDVLSLELQEARDQNELMEFRILESEQCQAKAALAESQIKCDKAIQLENQPSNELRNEQSKPGTMGSDLLEFVKRFPTLDTPTSATILASTATKSTKSVSSLESYTLTLSLTSEDEGLGDDGRRDQFSGPSSLSDIQMSDEESNGSGRRSKVSEAGVQTLNETMLTPLGPCKCCSKQSELESEISRLIEERDNLREQVLELEEAENDARLVSQRLQRQVENLVNQVDCLQISLVNANQQIEQSNETIRSLREDELKLKVDFMMALIAKHEESPSRLVEELKAKLKEKKSELASLEPLMLSSFNYDDRSADHGSLTRHNFKQAVYAQQQQQQQQQQLQQQQQQQQKQQQLQQQQQQQKNYQAAQLSQYQQYYQSSYADSNDCEIFIPEDSLPPDPGSSFHVQMIDSARYNRRSSNRSPLPICETVKPKKIDVLLSTSLTSSSSSPSSILPSSSASSSSPSPSLSPSSSPSSSPLISPSSSSSSSSSGDQEK